MIGAEADLYTFTDSTGEKNRLIEKSLLQVVDDSILPVFPKLAERQPLTYDDRGAVAMFAAFQRSRVPEFQASATRTATASLERMSDRIFADPAQVAEGLKSMEAHTGKPSEVSAEAMVEAWQSGKVRLKVNPKMALGAMVDISPKMAALLIDLDWTIMVAGEDCAFILSDNPFAIVPPRASPGQAVGLDTPGALKYLPLTKSHCLRMADHGYALRYAAADSAVVRVININTARNSRRFLYATDGADLKGIVEASGTASSPDEAGATVDTIPAADGGDYHILTWRVLSAAYHDAM
ncbi:MAG: hypothetical protein JWN34_3686 [Bryobacterales bacterium]|nr:hypothetical protein [Bryobacterales bacterium]